jgi:hypothetical protein
MKVHELITELLKYPGGVEIVLDPCPAPRTTPLNRIICPLRSVTAQTYGILLLGEPEVTR